MRLIFVWVCEKYGKSTYFATLICNPKWPEIKNNILNHETTRYRPDIVARVFQLKLKYFIKDLNDNQVLGAEIDRIQVIEFQKRGLPQAHIIFWINKSDTKVIEENMDCTISAEIPDSKTHPRLYDDVMKHMIHGPCGKEYKSFPCMDGDNCTKKFYKDFCDETELNRDGYPKYRRRNTGEFPLKREGKEAVCVDNRWVAPYNPYLLLSTTAMSISSIAPL